MSMGLLIGAVLPNLVHGNQAADIRTSDGFAYIFEGIIRKQMLRPHDGYQRDSAMFSLIESEWPAAKAKLEVMLNR